jgi:hypothetical protein
MRHPGLHVFLTEIGYGVVVSKDEVVPARGEFGENCAGDYGFLGFKNALMCEVRHGSSSLFFLLLFLLFGTNFGFL